MKQLICIVLFMVGSITVNAQNANQIVQEEVEVGDILRIGHPDASRFQHIDFPRPNFIIKKGGIANYKRVEGDKVVVTSIKEKKDGSLEVQIKLADGGRFFRTHYVVWADLKKALESGELREI